MRPVGTLLLIVAVGLRAVDGLETPAIRTGYAQLKPYKSYVPAFHNHKRAMRAQRGT